MGYKSQLSYIMDMLDIVGTDLAITLNLDRTLISKWKNSVRPLKPSNKHFNTMVEALIFFNSKNKSASLERFFGQVYPKEDKNEPEYLEVCLKIWLEGNNMGYFNSLNHWQTAENALYASKIDVYQGNLGKRHALTEFFKYALALPSGHEIFISDVEGTNWRDEDFEFSKFYHESINELTRYGHNITFIMPEDIIKSEPNQYVFDRIRTYFTGHITSYSLDIECKAPIQSLYLIHRHMALVSTCVTANESLRYITVNKDPFSIKHYVDMFIERIKLASPLLSNYAIQGKALDNFLNAYDSKNTAANVLLSAPELPIYMFPHQILLKILDDNKVSQDHRTKIENLYKLKKEILLRNLHNNEMDILLSKKTFEDMFEKNQIRHDSLSILCNRDIFLTKEMVTGSICHWEKISKKYNTVHLNLISFDAIPILENLNLYIFEDSMVIATQLRNQEYFITSEATLILNHVQNNLKNLLMDQEENSSLELFCNKLSDI